MMRLYCVLLIFNGKGTYNNIRVETNLVTSIYGKDTNPQGFIDTAVKDERVLYWDKR